MQRVFKLTACAALCLCLSCGKNHNDTLTLIDEVRQTENSFCLMTHEKGIQEAFYFFASDDGTIKRANDSLIHGKENIRTFYSDTKYKSAKVTWSPDYIDVSEDGTLAYTYGKYEWTVSDSSGEKKYKGIFHTVWKKMKDGKWKYVWD
jgi:ketosteroid isomerase-like protein